MSLNILITTAHFIEAHIYIFLDFDVTSGKSDFAKLCTPEGCEFRLDIS